MNILSILVLILHLIIILSISGVLLFSNDIYQVGFFAVLNLIVFIQVVVFDGCVLSKMEEKFPIINLSPTEVVKKVFFLENSDIRLQTIEKILVSLTLAAILGKFLILAIPMLNNEIVPIGLSKFISKIIEDRKIYLYDSLISPNKLSYVADIFAIPLFMLSSYYFYKKSQEKELTFTEKTLFFFSLSGLVCDSIFVFIMPFIE